MTADVAAMLRNPDITIADLERMRDESRTRRPYVGLIDEAIAEAAQAEIDRRQAAQ
ncbi:hypothetical protein ACFWMG_15510 [Streptomyces sp. NPDC127074]|uniref:hypothetical protein n=1 Tax=Streptomyces sp. NPDC127074 TaxID=3347130 RepID=UPI0036691ED5